MGHALVSGSVIAICYGIALIMWFVGGRHWPYVILALILTGTAGLMHGWIGDRLRQVVDVGNRVLGGLAGHLGVSITLAVGAVTLLIYLIYKLKHKEIDERVLFATAGLPLAAGSIAGPVGALLATLLGFITTAVVWVITSLFGIH